MKSRMERPTKYQDTSTLTSKAVLTTTSRFPSTSMELLRQPHRDMGLGDIRVDLQHRYYFHVQHGYWNSNGGFQSNGTHENEHFYYNGPCETPDIFTLTVDGEEYEVEYNMDYFDHCEQDGFNWHCWNDDYDYDGDGEPDWTSHQNECEEDNSTENGTASTSGRTSTVSEIEEGNHTMELTIDVEENMS